MNHPTISSGLTRARLLMFILTGIVVCWLFSLFRGNGIRDDLLAVDFGGIHHMGPNFNISEFYINGTNGFNVGREGGGGTSICCIFLPPTWRPGLAVDLRWEVRDWSRENQAEIAAGNIRSMSFKYFKAQVPVEIYAKPGPVEIHFFVGGKARVIVGRSISTELNEEIISADSHAVEIATIGQPTNDLFSREELNAMHGQKEDREKKYQGNWK